VVPRRRDHRVSPCGPLTFSLAGGARASCLAPACTFLDTSAVAKLYLQEIGSRRLAKWVGHRSAVLPPSVRLCVSRMVLPEAVSAITRRRNDRKITTRDALRLWNFVLSDFIGPTRYEIVEPSEAIVLRAALLVATHGMRRYDAVQLATALHVQMRLSDPESFVFVSADTDLVDAARAEGLTVANPML
jgi:predicted nucleic acid-binding protein